MKRWGLWLGLLMISLVVLAGCRSDRRDELVLAVGGAPAELDFWERTVEDFHRETGLRVSLLRQPTDTDLRRQNLMVALNGHDPDPDVFLMDIAWLAQFRASGWLEPLDAQAARTGFSTEPFYENILRLADTHTGRLYALPVYIDAGLLYGRQDLLARFGSPRLPETWEELVRVSRRAREALRAERPDFYGFVWQGAQYEGLICNFLEFSASNQGGLTLADGRLTVNTPANRQALEFMRSLIHDSRVSPPNTYSEMKEEETRLAFQNGRALFERNWPYAWALHQADDSAVKGRVLIGPLPHFPGGESRAALGGWHIGISAYSDRKAEAWTLVQYLAGFEVQKQMALRLGWDPGRRDVYADPEVLKRLPHFAALREVFSRAVPRPMVPYYAQLSTALQRQLHKCISGEIPAAEALAAAEDECRKIIARYDR